MSHRALGIVIRHDRARAFEDRWLGAAFLDFLVEPPSTFESRLEEHGRLDTMWEAHNWEAGLLVDFDASRVLWFGDPTTTYVGDPPQRWHDDASFVAAIDTSWRGFEITRVDDSDAFLVHLRVRGLRLEPPEVETPSALDGAASVRDRVLAPAVPAIDDHDAWLASLLALEAKEPEIAKVVPLRPTNEKRKAGCLTTLWILPFVLLALLVRVVSRPWRAALRRRAVLRAEREALAARAQLESLTRSIAASPGDPSHRLRRAEWLTFQRFYLAALRDYDAYFAAIGDTRPANDDTRRHRAAAHHNCAIAYEAMKLPRLAARDRARAAELGFQPPRRRWRDSLSIVRGLFMVLADEDD